MEMPRESISCTRCAEGGEVACSALAWRSEERKKGRASKAGRIDENRMPRAQHSNQVGHRGRRARVSESRPAGGGVGVFWGSLQKSLTPGLSELEPTCGPGRRYQHAAGYNAPEYEIATNE